MDCLKKLLISKEFLMLVVLFVYCLNIMSRLFLCFITLFLHAQQHLAIRVNISKTSKSYRNDVRATLGQRSGNVRAAFGQCPGMLGQHVVNEICLSIATNRNR